MSVLLSGGGVKGGRVVGATTKDGGEPATEAYTSRNLISTLLHAPVDMPQLRLLPAYSAVANVAMPLLFSGKPYPDAVHRAEEVLERVGLGNNKQIMNAA